MRRKKEKMEELKKESDLRLSGRMLLKKNTYRLAPYNVEPPRQHTRPNNPAEQISSLR